MNSFFAFLGTWQEFALRLSVFQRGALFLFALFAFVVGVLIFRAQTRAEKIQILSVELQKIFTKKLGKIPGLLGCLSSHLTLSDKIFQNIFALYSTSILRPFSHLHELLEANEKLQHEISFILRAANKHHAVNLDGNFLYARDFIIEYETKFRDLTRTLAAEIASYNRMTRWKNRLLLGLLFPPYSFLPEITFNENI